MKIIKYILILLILPFFSSSFAATYYIDYNAVNDSANGTAKSTPWKRHPYMIGFTGTYTHSAGDQYIFKGGVTWPVSCFCMNITAGGSAGTYDYYGVDATWYSGGSWSRPIFSAGGTRPTNDAFIGLRADYITIDNIEFTGLYWNASSPWSNDIAVNAQSNLWIKNTYHHGWSHAANATENNTAVIQGAPSTPTNIIIESVTIDGSDTTRDSRYGLYYPGSTVRNCTIKYVSNGILGTIANIYSNDIGPIVASFDPAAHTNAIETWNASNIYNNYVHDVDSGQVLLLYPSGFVQNVFNNVIWNITNFNGQNIVFSFEAGYPDDGGTVRVFNNTIVPQSGLGCIHTQTALQSLTVENNHCISTVDFITNAYNIGSYSPGTHNLTQTPTVASGQGYTSSNKYAPTSGSGGTVNAGTTITCSSCGSAINSDRLSVSRPQGSTWDIGAYEYVSTGGATLSPSGAPANLGADGGVVTLGP